MSAFSGGQFKGAMREHKKRLREEAEDRASVVLPERTRQYRLVMGVVDLLDEATR